MAKLKGFFEGDRRRSDFLIYGLGGAAVHSNEPPSQAVHGVQLSALSTSLYPPSVHASQVRSLVADPGAAAYWPARQVRAAQLRSFAAEAGVLTYSPATQVVQVSQLGWSGASLNGPLA